MMNTKVILIVASMLICVPAVSAEAFHLSGSGSYTNWEISIPVYPYYSNPEAFYYVGYATMEPTLTSQVQCWTDWNCRMKYAYNPPHTQKQVFSENVRLQMPNCPPNYGSVTEYRSSSYRRTVPAGWNRGALVTVAGYGSYSGSWSMFAATTTLSYNLTGTATCVDLIRLDLNHSGEWIQVYINATNDGTDTYNIPLIYEYDYRLYADGELVHEFTAMSDEYYNIDNCIYTTYKFLEMCNNTIKDSEGYYIEKQAATVISANDFYVASGILSVDNSSADNMYISTNTFIGNYGWVVDPVISNTTTPLTNSLISWGLVVKVVNLSNINETIGDATVRVNQSCYCNAGFSVRQKKTINGIVSYNDMSLQDASLWVHAPGYKIIDENSTGYSATLSGRTNFSSKTWLVKLAPSDCNNSSEWHETSETTKIFFKNEDGQLTSQIDDTDSIVYLYYNNNNSDGEDMTLRFESSSTHTYFSPVQSWNIPHGDVGRKTIVNADFTPFDYSYRAVMYNSSIYGWNLTVPLTVRDADAQTQKNYQNLSTFLWFRYAKDGKVDYRDDMKIRIHACSNNTSLMVVDCALYKDGVFLCYKNLTKTLLGSDYTYTWSPSYDYESGSVYAALLYGYDGTLLETEVVECITDTITRKNKLTIIVKSSTGNNLYNSAVFLEGWGQLATGTLYYNSYEGLENGTYRYKASKSGYGGAGWDEIVIADDDEIVTYILTSETSAASHTSTKMSDSDVKEIFFPCMFALLIFIVLGGLKYVLK